MELFKINSQGLISSQQNEDVFSRSITDDQVFSMQRFADNKITLSSGTGGIKLEAANSLTGVLSAYTLGRAPSSNTMTATPIGAVATQVKVGETTVYVAPMSTTGNAFVDAEFDNSYKLAVYSGTTSGNYRLGVIYKNLGLGSQVGIAAASNIFTNSSTEFYNYSSVLKTGATNISGTTNLKIYFPSSTTVYGTFLQQVKADGTAQTGAAATNLTVDFYDVNLTGQSYTFLGDATKSIDFVNSEAVSFKGLTNSGLSFNLNRTAITAKGQKGTTAVAVDNLFTVQKVNTGAGVVQSFTSINATSDAWVMFGVDKGSSVYLGSSLYKNANESASGTVTFGVTSDASKTEFVELGQSGNFTLNSLDSSTVYALADKATGTFALAAGTYSFDFDGIQGPNPAIKFSTTSAASITAVAGTSNILLGGSFTVLGSNTAVSAYTYTLSDSAVAKIGDYTYKDLSDNSSSASVSFATGDLTDVKIAGVFDSIYSSTDKGLTGIKFTMADSSVAKFGVVQVSDTADASSSQIVFGADSNTVTLGGAMSIGTSGTVGITFNMSNSSVVNIGGFTFSDVATAGASFKLVDNATSALVAGTYSVFDRTASTNALTHAAFTLSDAAVMQLGIVSASDTANSSNSYIAFATSDTVTLGKGGISVGVASSVLSQMTFVLSDTGAYTINGDTFSATSGASSNTQTVNIINTTVGYVGAYTSDVGMVTSEVSGFKLGSNISVSGVQVVDASKAKLFGDIYVGVPTNAGAAVTYSTISGSSNTIQLTTTGAGFQVSAVSNTGTGYTFVGLSSKTILSEAAGTYFLADGGSDVTLATSNALANKLTFGEVSDGTVTRLVKDGSNVSVFGSAILTAGSNVSTAYALKAIGTESSAIEINGIKFAASDASVMNAENATTYSLTTTGSDLSITGSAAANSDFQVLQEATGGFNFGGIKFAFESAITGNGFDISVASNATLVSNTAISQYTVKGSSVSIADGTTGSDVYTVSLGADGTVKEISEINSGAVLTKVGGAYAVHVNSDAGIFTFKTSSLITGDKSSATQVFAISGLTNSSDVTFVLSTDSSAVDIGIGTVVEIKGLGENAVVSVTDSTKATGTISWTKTVKDSISRNAIGTWGADKYMGYIVNSSDSNVYTLLGIASDTEVTKQKQEVASFDSATISSNATLISIVGSDIAKLPVTFQNTKGDAAKYGAQVSGTAVTSLFSDLGKTDGKLGVQVTNTNDTYSLSLVAVSDVGVPASFTTKAGLAGASLESITLSDTAALNVYNGFVVSGTGVAVAANSDTITVTGVEGSGAYIGMATTSDTVTFGSSDKALTYNINNGTKTNTLVINTNNKTGNAIASNTTTLSLSLSSDAYVKDTITSADDSIVINGVTYSKFGDAAVNYSFTAGTNKTLEINGGIASVASGTTTDIAFFSDTSIKFTGASGAGLVLASSGITYTVSSDATAAQSATFSITPASNTQKAVVTSAGTAKVKEDVAKDKTFFFNSEVYTATSEFASILLEGGKKDKFLEGTSATGITSATDSYTVAALSDTYVMASGASLTITYTNEAAYSDTQALKTFTSGSGTFTLDSDKTYHIASNYISGTTKTDSTTYVYTATTGGALKLTLTDGVAKINLGDVVGTRSAGSDVTTTFSFKPYATVTDPYTYTILSGSTDTLTFSLDSDTAKTYGAEGLIYKGVGTRTLASGDVTAASGTKLTYLGNAYSPAESATMKIEINNSTGTEKFIAGTGTFTAAIGDTFYYDVLNSDGTIGQDGIAETFTAKSVVTLNATFDNGTGTKIISANGTGEMQGSGTYVLSALSETYTMDSASKWLLDLTKGVGSETFTATSGSGKTASLSTFALSDKYLGFGAKAEDVFTYSGTAVLGLTMDGTNTTVAIANGSGTRVSTSASDTFKFNSKDYTATGNLTYAITSASATAVGATGFAYAGAGTRAFATGETGTSLDPVVYNSDTYSITSGTIGLDLKEGKGTETFISGLATFSTTATASSNIFHYVLGNNTNTYTATADVKFEVSKDSNGSTTLVSASGAGVRNLGDAESATLAVAALGSNTYVFGAGNTVQLTITNTSTAVESAYAGTGTYIAKAGDTAVAQFDAAGSATGTVYSYTSFADATTFQITLGSGTLLSQTLTDGSATRTSAGEDFTFSLNGVSNTYKAAATTGETGSMTFVLDATSAKANGAAGGITAGTGYRTNASTTYTVEASSNTYKSVVGEMKLTVASGTGTESLFNATASETFANGSTFMYQGTQYEAQSDGVVLKLDVAKGVASETGVSGRGAFESKAGTETFTYEANVYTATSGTKLAVAFGGSGTGVAELVSGSGNRTLASGDTFTFDKNVYLAEQGQLSVSRPTESDSVTTLFSAGTGTLKTDATGGKFFFTSPTDQKVYQYTDDTTNNANVKIYGGDPAQVKFLGGKASREDSTTGLVFTFDNNSYSSTGNAVTFTLGVNASNTAVETATKAEGTRGVDGTFTYLSPVSTKNETYTAKDVVLQVKVDGENGTETLKQGSGLRSLASGTTFAYAATALGGKSESWTTIDNTTTYELKLASGSTVAQLMAYDSSVVTETLTQAAATATVTNPAYTSIVTSQTETYNGDVTFKFALNNGSETVTWESGSATMKLDANKAFAYKADNANNVATYTVTADATFTRNSQTDEKLTAGGGSRLSKADETFNVSFLSDTYTADSGSSIVLSAQTASGTTVANEAFTAGTATYKADANATFHYVVGGSTRAYTADDLTTLQVSVADGSATNVVSATGSGKRGFENGESTTKTVLTNDIFNINSGTYTLKLTADNFANASETLTQGTGVYDAKVGSKFDVSDVLLGVQGSTDSTTYTFDALSETKLTLNITDGVDKVAVVSGLGTRSDNTVSNFTFNSQSYTKVSDAMVYSFASGTALAQGDLYAGQGTRISADASGTTVFNADTYTVDNGAVMTLTITEGKGNEVMTQGTATYKAAAGNAFHYSFDASNTKVYNAIGDGATLQIAMGASNTGLASISGQGTREAVAADAAMSTTYQSDTYHAVAGSSTVVFTATGDPKAVTEDIFSATGVVVSNVASGGKFHNNTTGNWYEYTASNAVDISLSLNDSVQSFSADPNATRTAAADASGTFVLNAQTYTQVGEATFSLTGSGTKLTDAVLTANGYRTNINNDSYTSKLSNTYILSAGTYSVAVASGTGVEALTAGTGTATYAANTGVFTYTDGKSYTANGTAGATLGLSVVNSVESETLTQGAGFDGSNTYIMTADAKLDVSKTAGTAEVGVSSATGIVTVTADAAKGITAVSGAESLTANFMTDQALIVDEKTYQAKSAAGLNFNSGFTAAAATSGTLTAEGDFTGSKNPSLSGKTLGVANDTDVMVTFDTSKISTIEKLSGGVQINDAAGATKAITDTEGNFQFNNSASQTFVVNADANVTFQLDDKGVVTGIVGIDPAASGAVTISVTDSGSDSKLIVSEIGKVLTRNSETGAWTETAVEAVAYIVEADSTGTLTYSAVDAHGDKTKVNDSVVGSVSGKTITLNEGLTARTPVIVVNESTDTISLPGYVEGIGLTSGAAVQVDSDTTATGSGAFKAGTLNNTTFTKVEDYTVTGATFELSSTGAIRVDSTGNAAVRATDTSKVTLIADTVSAAVTVNDGPQMTFAIGSDDKDGKGEYGLVSSNATVTGLTPSGVETGTVVLPTNADGTTFSVNSATVTVRGDGDGMTLAVKSDNLYGLEGIDTNATISASGVDALAVDGTDTVAVSSDPIKYNTTNGKWIAGNAPAAEGVTGYLINVNSDGRVSLAYQTATDTLKYTTNVADYNKVFTAESGLAPDEDGGELKVYGGSIELISSLGSDVGVTVAANNGGVALTTTNSEGRNLVLSTSGSRYTVNDQEVIPSTQVTVNASTLSDGEKALTATVSGNVAIGHNSMNFSADTDTEITFTSNSILLNDSAKVTNTSSDQTFSVKGKVAFDNVVLLTSPTASTAPVTVTGARTSDANAANSGLSVNGKDLNVVSDASYTVDAINMVISGISAPATVNGSLVESVDAAKLVTDSTGTYRILATDFTIGGDSAVVFSGSKGSVTAIDSLEGTATGDFGTEIKVNGKSVLILGDGDSLAAVTANSDTVTEITSVGNANGDVTIANAGGASVISTDKNGGIYFGAPGASLSKHYTVTDEDSVVSFMAGEYADYIPSISGVNGLANGNIAISQDESAFSVNGGAITLGSVSKDVTLNVANSVITSVNGLQGMINGVNAGVAVEIVDNDATVNGSQISISEPSGTNVIYSASSDSTIATINGLNKDAVVNVAANMNILTAEAGTFSFNNGTFTISGDDEVTFETDARSRVKNVAGLVGTVQSSATNNTINGAAVSSNDTDVTIVGSGSGVSSILGAKDGDSINAPAGTAIQIAGSSDPTVTTSFAINGKQFELTGDTDTIVVTPGSPDSISGLAAGATLKAINTAGTYNVNGSEVQASVGAVIIGDEEGTAHVYDPTDFDVKENDSVTDIANKLTNGKASDDANYVEDLDSDASKAALEKGGTALDGNIKMTVATEESDSDTTKPQTIDLSKNTGIKNVTLEPSANQEQQLTLNDEDGNIVEVPDDQLPTPAPKTINLGKGRSTAVIGKTNAQINVSAKGPSTIISKAKHLRLDLSGSKGSKFMANGVNAYIEASGYNHENGGGITSTYNSIYDAVVQNNIKLENGTVTSNGGKVKTGADPSYGGSSADSGNATSFTNADIVNFFNLKGLMTKVGYTYDEGGEIDASAAHYDMLIKANFQENGAQQKTGTSKVSTGSGDDSILAGSGDVINAGSGNNIVKLSESSRTNRDNGAVISQTATEGTTSVEGFHNDTGNTGDRVDVSSDANAKYDGTNLTIKKGKATLVLKNIQGVSGSSADLAVSADEDDNATALSGTIDYAAVLIGDSVNAVKTAVASSGNWIGGSDSLWSEDNIPQAYLGEHSGIDMRSYDGSANITLPGASNANSDGKLGTHDVSFRGIEKLRLGTGSSTVYGAANVDNTIVTGLGASSVWGGGSSNDTFISRQESHKTGSSTFFYVDGDGKDVISNFEFLASDASNSVTADVVNVLGTKITGAAISGNDVVIQLASGDDNNLTIKEAVGKEFRMEYGNVGAFETLVAQVNNNSLTVDANANYYQATGKNATVSVSSALTDAEVWLDSSRNNTTFVGDISVLNAGAVEGKSTLAGNQFDNVIYGSAGNSSMWGGSSSETNDTLVGGAGADMFWYGKNEGNDVINNVDGNDVVNLYNVSIADVEAYDNWNITNNAISFKLKDGGSLTINSSNSGIGFKFADDANTYTINQRTREYTTK